MRGIERAVCRRAAGVKEQGEETKLISWICAKLKKDKPISAIIEDFGELGEPEEKVSLICETARRFAPDYDADQIYAVLAKKETEEVKKP